MLCSRRGETKPQMLGGSVFVGMWCFPTRLKGLQTIPLSGREMRASSLCPVSRVFFIALFEISLAFGVLTRGHALPIYPRYPEVHSVRAGQDASQQSSQCLKGVETSVADVTT